jgi:hypothetical protein
MQLLTKSSFVSFSFVKAITVKTRRMFSFQLLAGNFGREFKFGVPKHSELEPDCWLAEGVAVSASQRRITS